MKPKPKFRWEDLYPVISTGQPEGSVTPDQLAARMKFTPNRASQILRADPRMRPVYFREGGRRRVCFVVKP